MVEPRQPPQSPAAVDAQVREAAAVRTHQLREARLADVVERIATQRDALSEQVADLIDQVGARDAVIAELRAALPSALLRPSAAGTPGPTW